MPVAASFTPASTAFTRPQMGTAEPRLLTNVTITGWSAITSQQGASASVTLAGGFANSSVFQSDFNVVELRWDMGKDANAWESGLVLLPAALTGTPSSPTLQVNLFNASGGSITPASHQFVLAIW